MGIWSSKATRGADCVPASKTETQNGRALTLTSTKRALLIGANYKNGVIPLFGCVNDVNNMKTFLLGTPYPAFSEGNMTLMTDDPLFTTDPLLVPKRANIIAQMTRLVELTQPGDTLFIHYSGHGSQQYNTSTMNSEGCEDCLVTVDEQFIEADELNKILVRGLRPGTNLIFFCDSCHSGSILDLPLRMNLTQLSDPSYVVDNPSELGTIDDRDIVMISGCRSDQGSGDTYEHRQAQGCYTWAVLSVFKHLMINDPKAPAAISWKQLLLLIRQRLISHTYEQVPQLAFSSVNYLNSLVDL